MSAARCRITSALYLLALMGSCGGGGGSKQEIPREPTDAASDRGSERATADVLPAFGLTARPANPTCKRPDTTRTPAALLSATGCADSEDPTKPAAGLIPYTVASPLWSDGAEKERFMALPDGARIHVKNCRTDLEACKPVPMGGSPADEGHLDVPDGTVLVKTFLLGGKRVETRLLVRFNRDTWVGYTYAWNDAQTDAALIEDSVVGEARQVQVGGKMQEWYFPSRPECLRCHTDGAGVSLGLELAQLNVDYVYPSGVKSNQLDTLEAIGLFDAPLPRPLPAPLPDPGDPASGSVEQRARSYLHTNCGLCHRPESNFPAFDTRYATPLADTRLCDRMPEKGNLGVQGALLIVPGEPGKSLVSLRMHTLGVDRMPQLATSVVDTEGAAVVDAWIGGMKTCP